MIERPILFNDAMVRAVLAGQKTVTRRAVPSWQLPSFDAAAEGIPKWLAIAQRDRRYGFAVFGETEDECAQALTTAGTCPIAQVGGRLWVREAFADIGCRLTYRASRDDGAHCQVKRWTPSIHMPRWASRLTLEVTAVRIERVQAISLDQIRAEGLDTPCVGCAAEADLRGQWKDLWESTGGDWQANPWVWVVEFRVVPRDGSH